MANTSATGGYLTPTSVAPTYDLPLDVQVQSFVAGITGLAGALVRPRWQPSPPAQPTRETNWCAVGITEIGSQFGHYIRHDPAGEGTDEAETYEDLELLASFYGPGSSGLAALLRDGLWIAQNREAMRSQGLAFVDARRVIRLGELVNQQFILRVDLPISLRRTVSRTYPILNLLQAQIALQTESHTQNFLAPES